MQALQFILPFSAIGQNRTQSLVLNNSALIDLLQLVKNPIGQVAALVTDGDASVRIALNRFIAVMCTSAIPRR